MSRADDLRQIVRVLMRVMLISERTPSAHQHVERFNPHDFHTLGMLRETSGLRASEIAQALAVAPTTASSLISRLERRGLVQKLRSQDDGRAVSLSLTAQGAALAQAIHDQDLRNMELFLSALEPEEQDQMIGLLGKVVARVRQLEAGNASD